MKKGVTLIELLITMTVLAVIMTSFTSIYSSGLRTFRQEMTQTQLQSEAQTLADRMTLDIKKSRNTIKNYDTFTENERTMILEIPSVDAAGKFLYIAGNQLTDKIVYYQSGSSLKRKVYSNERSIRMGEHLKEKTLTTNLLNLNFTNHYLLNDVTNLQVDVEIDLQKKIGNQTRKVKAKGSGSFRNIQ